MHGLWKHHLLRAFNAAAFNPAASASVALTLITTLRLYVLEPAYRNAKRFCIPAIHFAVMHTFAQWIVTCALARVT